ncbi:SMP-30/gluconolactonase/LRE family protein [Xylophilus sp. GOD-11R]|uniref:SMP-30/gluconolactonase/LRE family protein n=1 Tax=Xylophilus sp. GOD-11R TaxID=3089814 RepID=UPI00298C443B|nr:L-dopachrome tautomerase-related protein [Xylophilus sp. GOD-11R]WPB55838.1 L-dopachrome tautomerase-related protein [Xylophilus sp. GOD-11R]
MSLPLFGRHRATLSLVGCAVAVSLLAGCAQPGPSSMPPPSTAVPGQLQELARFDHQVTGVTVSPANRIFVNFPRWTDDAPVSVAEVLPDGRVRPFPNEEWNAWRNARKDEMTAADHFVCVQSVVVDHQGYLWALDAAAPAQGPVVPMGPKLVKIDLSSDRVVKTIAFDEKIAPHGSYLNDVRFSTDGKTAYITDSGARGAIVVVDLVQGTARRVLDGHASTQVDKTVQVKADGQVLRRPDGRGVEFSADGIALSVDGTMLYWQAIKGKTLYRVPTRALGDVSAAPRLPSMVETVGENGPVDGMLFGRDGRLFLTSPEDDSVKVRDSNGGLRVLAQSPALRWPDTMAQGADGTLYVTASRIQDMSWYKPGSPNSLPTTLFRITNP